MAIFSPAIDHFIVYSKWAVVIGFIISITTKGTQVPEESNWIELIPIQFSISSNFTKTFGCNFLLDDFKKERQI